MQSGYDYKLQMLRLWHVNDNMSDTIIKYFKKYII